MSPRAHPHCAPTTQQEYRKVSSTRTDRIDGVQASTALKAPCVAATTGNITLSGEQAIDGVSVASGNRVLVKDQTDSKENGIYIASTTGWARAPDFDGARDVVQGTTVRVYGGSVNGGSWWEVTTANTVDIGSDNITFQTVDIPAASIGEYLLGTSTTSLSIGTGSKVFTTQANRAWSVGTRLRAASDDASKVIEGEVTSYSGTTLTIDSDYTIGAGTHADWNISIAGAQGATGADGTIDISTLTNLTSLDDTADELIVRDDSDSGNNKAVTVGAFYTSINALPEATIAATDIIVFTDTNDSAAPKRDTVQGIIDLVPTASSIASLTEETIPALDDLLRLHDTSEGAENSMQFQNFFKTINLFTEDTGPNASNDFVVTYDASAAAPKKVKLSNLVALAATSAREADVFTSSGTWTKPAGFTGIVKVTVVGGGGGGSGPGSAPTNGGTSSFGSHCSATGGGSSASAITTGGVGSGGDINLRGGGGFYGNSNGFGGGSILSGPVMPGIAAGANTGCGGGGNNAGNGAGGAAGGASIVWLDASALGATETVTIGAGGTASNGGGSNNGAAGIIIVEYL